MQITSRFTIAMHIITAIDYFKDEYAVTSKFLAGSIGANAVIIRNIMGELKEAGIISVSKGKSGIMLARPLDEISFYDVYKAVDSVSQDGLFKYHDNLNPDCPVARNIQTAMDGKLNRIQAAMEKELKKYTAEDDVKDTRDEIKKEKQ